MKINFALTLLLSTCMSCNKELKCKDAVQLTSEKTQPLVGTWKLDYTNKRVRDKGSGTITEDTLQSESNSSTYKIEFNENGKIIFYEDEKSIHEFCVGDLEYYNSAYYIYNINLIVCNNNLELENVLLGIHVIDENNIVANFKDFSQFPFINYEETKNEQIYYTSYFKKL